MNPSWLACLFTKPPHCNLCQSTHLLLRVAINTLHILPWLIIYIEINVHFNGKVIMLLGPNQCSWVTSDQCINKINQSCWPKRKLCPFTFFTLLLAFKGNKYTAVKTLSSQLTFQSFIYQIYIECLLCATQCFNWTTDKGLALLEFKFFWET